jgi:hypothetical protein
VTVGELRAVRDASPFRPFVIRMADGREFRVRHRDFLAISPTGRTMIVYPDDNSDAHSILDLLLMTELSVEAVPAPGDGAA